MTEPTTTPVDMQERTHIVKAFMRGDINVREAADACQVTVATIWNYANRIKHGQDPLVDLRSFGNNRKWGVTK